MFHSLGLSPTVSLLGQGLNLLQVILLTPSPEVGPHVLPHYWLFGIVDRIYTLDDPLLVSVKISQFLLHTVWMSHPHGRPIALPLGLHFTGRSEFSNEVCQDLSFYCFSWFVPHIELTKFYCPLD